MNKTFKKMISLMIALALVLAMGLTTIAATVEVKDSDDYVAERTFKAYKVFDGDYEDGKLVNLTAGDGIDWDNVDWEAIQAIGTDFGEVDSANALITALDGKNTATGEKVAKVLKDATAGEGTTVANGDTLEDGYYIIIDETELADNDVANAALLQVAGDKVTINVKTDKPKIEKKIDGNKDKDSATEGLVDTNNGQVNDLVPYVITSTVPDTTYYDNYYMEFVDTVSSGLDISALDATGDAAYSDYKVFVGDDPMDATQYELTVNGRQISVKFKNVKGLDGKVLKLTYNAKINKDAVVGVDGNPNEVILKYTNSPDHSGDGEFNTDDYTSETPKDVVITYLTGIKILKIDANTKDPLEGAEFQISGTRTVASVVSGTFFEEATDGTYYKLKNGSYTTDAPTDATTDKYASTTTKYKKTVLDKVVKEETTAVKVSAVSEPDGTIIFNDLGAGTYTFTEIAAPEGYNKLETPISVTISFTAPTGEIKTGEEKCTWTAEGDGAKFDSATGTVTVTIENNSGSTLPFTGGMGTTLFYILGAVLVLGAGVVLISRRRMEA